MNCWEVMKWKYEERWNKVFDYLFKHKDHIIALGFTPEVEFTMGDNQIILKGHNAGRKKDK